MIMGECLVLDTDVRTPTCAGAVTLVMDSPGVTASGERVGFLFFLAAEGCFFFLVFARALARAYPTAAALAAPPCGRGPGLVSTPTRRGAGKLESCHSLMAPALEGRNVFALTDPRRRLVYARARADWGRSLALCSSTDCALRAETGDDFRENIAGEGREVSCDRRG